jgi:hypothetical protein
LTKATPNLKSRIEAAESDYQADIYLYSGPIDDKGYGQLVGALVSPEPKLNSLLILTTNGGQGSTAYQIARLFHKTYDQFFLYTPSYCKSAGTLIALGAHKLIMDVFSELGPLDVQLPSRDELWEQRSGLISRSAFNSLTEASFEMYQQFMLAIKLGSKNKVSFKLASEISTRLACQLMTPIYGQLNPDVIGSDFRDLNVAMEYGRRLAKICNNPKPHAVRHLVRNYPSHDFIIDDDEARSLFIDVEVPKPSLYALIECFDSMAFEEQEKATVLAMRNLGEIADDQQGEELEGLASTSNGEGEATSGVDEDREAHRTRNSGKGASGVQAKPNGRRHRSLPS